MKSKSRTRLINQLAQMRNMAAYILREYANGTEHAVTSTTEMYLKKIHAQCQSELERLGHPQFLLDK